MASTAPPNIAIIGGSIAGLTLALSLHAQSIPCTVYESREPSYRHGGAIMLAANALRILDKLGAYSRVKGQGFSFRAITFRTDESHEKEGEWFFGDEAVYGYDGLRIFRYKLLHELRKILGERGIPILYEKKYSRVVSESKDEGVVFELADGSRHRADILVGADGIHSKVRRYLTDARPVYLGAMAITFAVDTKTLRLPSIEGYQMPVSISGQPGSFILAPQGIDGSECLAGTQWKYPEQTREGWDAMLADTDGLVQRLNAEKASWGDLPQSAIENIKPGTMNLWPFYRVPDLERWTSERGRVVVVGDAAHAIPPTVGQGANQAFEDGFALAMLLGPRGAGGKSGGLKLEDKLAWWRQYRHNRVARVLKLTLQMNNQRLPAAEKAKLSKDQLWDEESMGKQGSGGLRWLYDPDIEGHVEEFLKS